MAGADYYLCPICDGKALYDHDPYSVGRADVEVIHTACLETDRANREKALRAQLAGRIQGWIDGFEVPEEWREAIDAYKDALVIVRGEVGDGR